MDRKCWFYNFYCFHSFHHGECVNTHLIYEANNCSVLVCSHGAICASIQPLFVWFDCFCRMQPIASWTSTCHLDRFCWIHCHCRHLENVPTPTFCMNDRDRVWGRDPLVFQLSNSCTSRTQCHFFSWLVNYLLYVKYIIYVQWNAFRLHLPLDLTINRLKNAPSSSSCLVRLHTRLVFQWLIILCTVPYGLPYITFQW